MSKPFENNMLGAPNFGQHNETILKNYLGLKDKSYERLRAQGAISEKIDITAKEIMVAREEREKEGSVYSYDPNFKSTIKSYFGI